MQTPANHSLKRLLTPAVCFKLPFPRALIPITSNRITHEQAKQPNLTLTFRANGNTNRDNLIFTTQATLEKLKTKKNTF